MKTDNKDFDELKKEFISSQLESKVYYSDGDKFLPIGYCQKENIEEKKKIKVNSFQECNLSEDTIIKVAIVRAYEDSQARLIPGHKNIVDELYTFKKEKPLGYLMCEIKNYINNKDNTDFSSWHKDICNKFLKKYNELLKNKIGNNSLQEFGKAQKVVNMAFKYLYCMGNYADDIFEDCHMPLDKYTLNWIRMLGDEEINKELVSKGNAWSNIDYTLYEKIQNLITNKLKDKVDYELYIDNKTIKVTLPDNKLKVEFIIWYQEKLNEIRKTIDKLNEKYSKLCIKYDK